MSKAAPARKAALAVLVRAQERSGYVRELLAAAPELGRLDARDRALATRLALGVTAAQGALDELLDRYLTKPGKVSPRVRAALRIAAFELAYLGTPDAAAVSQGVELVRGQARSAAGLANAVLRRVAAGRTSFLGAEDVAPDKRALAAQARRAGLPRWLVAQIAATDEKACADLCACALEPAPVYLQANPCRMDAAAFEAEAAREGLRLAPTEFAGCYAVGAPAALAHAPLMERCDAAVSDVAAQMVAAAAVRPGSLLEVGSGRGTKTFVASALAHRAGWGEKRGHVAVDLYPRKAALNAERLRAAGMPPVACVAADGRALRSAFDVALPGGPSLAERCAQGFDAALVDAPCSGTGTMRRHPEIPWRLEPAEVDPGNPEGLPALQQALLAEAARCVRPGGALLYATCSVLRAEDEDVVAAFLATEAGSAFRVRAFSEAPLFSLSAFASARAWAAAHETPEGYMRTAPSTSGPDGHFCAQLVRTA